MTDQVSKHAHLAMTGERIGKNVKSIALKGKALDKLVHETAVAVIIYSMPQAEGGHLDMSKALPLVQAVTEAGSRRRLAAWFEEFSNIRITTQKEEDGSLSWKSRLLRPADTGYRPARPLEANDMPYWALNVEAEPVAAVALDTIALLRILRGALKKIEDADTSGLQTRDLVVVKHLKEEVEKLEPRAEQLKAQRDMAKAVDREQRKAA